VYKTYSVNYQHGSWYREGEFCIHSDPILPSGFEAEYTIKESENRFVSKIKGWSSGKAIKFEDKIIFDPEIKYTTIQGGTYHVNIGKDSATVTVNNDEDILKLAQEKIMKENCNHKAMTANKCLLSITGPVYHNDEDFLCRYCNKQLLPNWTVKPEPLVVEFETEFKLPDGVTPEMFRFNVPDEIGMQMFGKRFKITAEEIL
jgi:hypothetical protein